jgi:phosphoribosylformylglycinamidine synthase
MAEILTLRGAAAFSATRISRITETLHEKLPSIRSLSAEQWFFIELQRPLSADEAARLSQLLSVPAVVSSMPQGSLLLVTPRLGTISPWSSKATDIARQCGFEAVVRIEHGTAYFIDAGRPLDESQRAAVLPLIHDRMTESVLADAAAAHALK